VPIVPVDRFDPARPGDLPDPRLVVYANMRDAELAQRADPLDDRAHAGLFIAEGHLVLSRLARSTYPVHSVLTTPARLPDLADTLDRLHPDVPVFVAPPSVLSAVVGFNMHRGVLGVGIRPPPPSFDQLASRPGPLLILEDLVNHDNLGGIFRNAAALAGPGVGVLLSPRCADPLYRKSLRVSMGLALSVPFARATDWPDPIARLRARGWKTWALTPRVGAADLAHLARSTTGPVALILGSEGPGLTDAAIAQSDHPVRIAMHPADPAVDSLNVAMAAGIALALLGEAGRLLPARG
jgi:tRNA G18 (ribose-2'-O)-methylase SpoU